MSTSGKEALLDSSWSIQIPEDCSIGVEIAVRDLQKYLKKEKKTKIELNKTKTVKPSNKVITVCANGSGGFKVLGLMGYDTYRLEIKQESILICGSDERGTIDGVYYLEKLLAFSNDTSVDIVETTRKPVFKYRFANCGDGSEEMFAHLSRIGINHIHMLGTSCWDMCFMESLTPSDMFPWDGQWIKWDEERIAQINEVFNRARKYGMDCWLYVRGTQPFKQGYANYNTNMDMFNARGWLTPGEDIFEKYPDVRGSNRGMGPRQATPSSRWDTPPCWSSKHYQRFIRETCQNLFRAVPNLKGLILVPSDLTLWCDDTCEACRGKSLGTRIGNYVNQLREAAKSVRDDAKVILWTFAFPYANLSDREKLLDSVPKDVIIVQSYTDGRRIEFDGEFLEYGYDYDFSTVPIPGEVFKYDAEMCEKKGLEFLNYQALGGAMEASGSPVPYNDIQIMSDVKQIGGSGIFDETFPGRELAGEMYYWTSWEQKPEIHKVLEKIAVRDFGEKAAPKVIEAWKQISYGASKIPACSLHVGQSLIHNMPYLSLYPVSDPRDFIPLRGDNPGLVYYHLRKVLDVGPNYLEKLTKFFKRAAEEMDKGIEMLHKADELVYKETGKRQIEEWMDRVTSHVCGFYSMVNYLEFVKVLRNKTPWQREQMMELMRKEIENTRRHKAAAERWLARRAKERPRDIVHSRYVDTRELEKKIVEMELEMAELEKGVYYRRVETSYTL